MFKNLFAFKGHERKFGVHSNHLKSFHNSPITQLIQLLSKTNFEITKLSLHSLYTNTTPNHKSITICIFILSLPLLLSSIVPLVVSYPLSCRCCPSRLTPPLCCTLPSRQCLRLLSRLPLLILLM
ncbi:uncharacterized protein DS421_8g243440 [Arachis hypogaea]|nr:uncharacterized protein DS421_8g243440 [Arachis hypogaea]